MDFFARHIIQDRVLKVLYYLTYSVRRCTNTKILLFEKFKIKKKYRVCVFRIKFLRMPWENYR